ncbi:L-xylulose reductase [Orchesella cincta]|uniref:L-xylulose reductase n=1 Tax=Orchesella cincta TaxID=48709 RepID=A0A1D2M3Y5_ORCCI|nr:L-xylulose reductase [Orchesella cincta]
MSLKYCFAGKRILITGGGQGIGRQLVQRFHDDKALVFVIDNNRETINPAFSCGPGGLGSHKKAIQSFGVLDHVVNNAAVAKPQMLMDVTMESAKLQFDVNFFACINVAQTAARKMIDVGSGGTFVETQIHKSLDPAMKNQLLSRNIIKRAIDPNEIADLVMFLLSPLSAMITGETVVVDGGASASIM